jgi:multidrug transporter EmrE-like cation transporter
MRLTLVLFVLLSVLLSSGSQILLKFGMSASAIKDVLSDNSQTPLQVALAVATSPPVILGLFCFGLSALVWLFVLSKIPLSTAYPFVALGIAITVAAGRLMFDEPLSAAKLFGVSLIVAGVTTVAVSA